MTQATQMTPAELRHRVLNKNRAERRQICREHWQTMQPWLDPEYSHLTRSEARKVSWENYWDAFKVENVKAAIERDVIAEVLATEYPRALRPIIRWVCALWNRTVGRWLK